MFFLKINKSISGYHQYVRRKDRPQGASLDLSAHRDTTFPVSSYTTSFGVFMILFIFADKKIVSPGRQ